MEPAGRSKIMKKLIWTMGISTAIITAAAGLGGCASGVQAQPSAAITVENVDAQSKGVTVTGREEVKVVPDMAEICLAISTQAETADECQANNAKDVNSTIEALKGLGVEETSIQTSNYGMNPIYNWDAGQQIVGYEMTTQITVSDVLIDQAGEIITKSVEAGTNRIDSVRYFASDYDAGYQKALEGAMAQAKKKAESIAAAGEKTLGAVINVEEYGYNPQVRYAASVNMAGGAMKEESLAADMGVMPGQVSIEAQVSVTFELQ